MACDDRTLRAYYNSPDTHLESQNLSHVSSRHAPRQSTASTLPTTQLSAINTYPAYTQATLVPTRRWRRLSSRESRCVPNVRIFYNAPFLSVLKNQLSPSRAIISMNLKTWAFGTHTTTTRPCAPFPEGKHPSLARRCNPSPIRLHLDRHVWISHLIEQRLSGFIVALSVPNSAPSRSTRRRHRFVLNEFIRRVAPHRARTTVCSMS